MYVGDKSFDERINANKDCDVKSKYWAFLIYPDDPNTPENWLKMLRDLCIPMVISPLHNQDLKDDGTLVKPHYHIEMEFDISQRITFAQKISDQFTGVNVEAVKSPSGYYYYMDHSHTDDKVVYDKNEIIYLGGFNPDRLINVSKAQLQRWRLDIEKYIVENEITEYWDLCTALASHDMDLKDYCDTHTIEIKAKLSSYKNILIKKDMYKYRKIGIE